MALVRLVFFQPRQSSRGQTVETHLLVVVPEAGEISQGHHNPSLASLTLCIASKAAPHDLFFLREIRKGMV